MKYIFMLMIAVAIHVQTAFAQQKINYYPDSIRIELPEQHTLVVFGMRSIKKDHAFIKNFPALFQELLNYVQKSTQTNFSETGPYTIDIKILPEGVEGTFEWVQEGVTKPIGEKTSITINKSTQPQTHVLVKEKQIVELLPPGWEVSITSNTYKVNIYSETYQGLVSLGHEDFSQTSSALVDDPGMKVIGRKSMYARFSVNENKIQKNSIKYIHPGDNIFLTAIAGVGLLHDKLYPELSFKLGLTFKDHFFRQNIRTSVIYNNLFFAEKTAEKYNTFVNSFLSLSFERNFNPKNDHPHWSGIGAGLLVRKNGDYFVGKTAKFFITHEIGNRVNIVPEFYLTNDFKKFTFGMTLKYSF
jgi:hypothetical protein